MLFWIEEYNPAVLHHLKEDEERPPRAAWSLFLSGTCVAHAAVDQENTFYAISATFRRQTVATEIADACAELMLFIDAADWSADSVPDQMEVSPAMARRLMDGKAAIRCAEMEAVALKPTTSSTVNLEGLAAAIATLNGHLARDEFGNAGQGTTAGIRQARDTSNLTDAVVVGVEEAAKMLGISRASITRMISSGALPSMMIQGRRLIAKDVLHEMVSKGAIPKG